eukprot:TRINITY_DN25841_c0_g1_i1.p1 TRINITY_DN25841_c0_g1~~TRINITY_DN25841_c0_g1_i1.p1  ORF type:complete len:1924 (-),score=383.78 TRINITY_DN25841_c0_g1_i1:85-5856(-)
MDVLVSVLGSKHLSQSSLIARSLYSTLQINGATHRAAKVEVEDVPFVVPGGMAGAASKSLVITLRNGHTQTAMYVRHIPLSVVCGSDDAINMWVAVHASSDPLSQSTDDIGVQPRPDVPQILLSMRRVGSDEGGCEEIDLERLRNTQARLEAELEQTRNQTSRLMSGGDRSVVGHNGGGSIPSSQEGSGFRGSTGFVHETGTRSSTLGRPSVLDSPEVLAIRETERQAQDIKSKVNAMADAQRQAQSAEQQLQDILREVSDVCRRVEQAEQELQVVTLARHRGEREKSLAREKCSQARETLRLRDLSILELQGTRDHAERQLSEALSDRERQRTDMDTSLQRFDAEVRNIGAELDRWRAEATSLADAVQLCDRRVLELRERSQLSAAADFRDTAEFAALQQQLDDALADLNRDRTRCEQAQKQARDLEVSLQEARETLAQRELLAVEKRQRTKQLRLEVGACERELIVQIGRAAQLDGQVGENRNQLRDLEGRHDDVRKRVERHDVAEQELQAEALSLRELILSEEKSCEHDQRKSAELEEQLKRIREEVEQQRHCSAELNRNHQEADSERSRSIDTLSATRRSLTNESTVAKGEIERLTAKRASLGRDIDQAEAEVTTREKAVEELDRRARDAEKELEALKVGQHARERERDQTAHQLTELEIELERVREELLAVETEACDLESASAANEDQLRRTELELQADLVKLRAQLNDGRAEAEMLRRQESDHQISLEETRRVLQDKRKRLTALREAEGSQKIEGDSSKASLQELRRSIAQQASALGLHRESQERSNRELDVVASDMNRAETKEKGLQESLDATREHLGQRAVAARDAFCAAEQQREDIVEELQRLKAHRQSVVARRAASEAALRQSEASLEGARRDAETAQRESGLRMKSFQEELATAEAEGAESEARAATVEAQLESLELQVSEGHVEEAALTRAVDERRQALAEARLTLEHWEQKNRASLHETKPRLVTKFASLQDDAAAEERRTRKTHEELKSAEVEAARVRQLEAECEAVDAALRATRIERDHDRGEQSAELELTRRGVALEASKILAEKNAELDRHIELIDVLERDVLTLSSKVEGAGHVKGALMKRVSAAEEQGSIAKQRLEAEQRRLLPLRDELATAKAVKQRKERQVQAVQQRAMAAAKAADQLEQEAKALADGLTELRSRTAQANEEQRTRLENLRKNVASQEALGAESQKNAKRLEIEVQGVRNRFEGIRQGTVDMKRHVELLRGELQDIEQDQQGAEKNQKRMEEQTRQQLQTFQEIEDEVARFQQGTAAEEQKIHLLREQLKTRSEDYKHATGEARVLEVTNEDLKVELDGIREQLSSLEDNLSYQVEHGNLQFTSIEKLEEEISRHAGEAEVLTLGLHDAEQRSEFLQKENFLMRQQVEGIYKGSLQDWALEVLSVKVAAEVERNKDELSHWQQVAEDAERDIRVDVEAAQRRQEEVEATLRRKLDDLSVEIQRYDKRIKTSEDLMPSVQASVHTLPAAMHGFVSLPARLASALAAGTAGRRRALVVGCNCSKSHAPLQGCANDAWNVQCLLRHSLHFREEQVRCLINSSSSCPSPPRSQASRDNIADGIRWLVSGVQPGDSVLFYFSGYSTKQVVSGRNGHQEVFLVPQDFAEDLPPQFLESLASGVMTTTAGDFGNHSSTGSLNVPQPSLRRFSRSPVRAQQVVQEQPGFRRSVSPSQARRARMKDEIVTSSSYRLIAISEIRHMLTQLPRGCKATIILDCYDASVPGMKIVASPLMPTPRASNIKGADIGAPIGVEGSRGRVGQPRADGLGDRGWRNRRLDLPALSVAPRPSIRLGAIDNPAGGQIITMPSIMCAVHAYAACTLEQPCAEMRIEGVVQGLFTWAFVKALTACHLEGTLNQHNKALQHILLDFRSSGLSSNQSPVLQIGGPATTQDIALLA